MNRRRSHFLTALAFAIALSNPALGDPMSEHASIQNTIDTMTAAFAAHDIDAIMATYEPDAVVVGEPGKPLSGSPALRAMFAEFIALDPRFSFTAHDIVQARDIALHFNVWRMTGTTPDGAPIEQGGLSVVVLRKQADGSWLMVIDNPYGNFLLDARQ